MMHRITASLTKTQKLVQPFGRKLPADCSLLHTQDTPPFCKYHIYAFTNSLCLFLVRQTFSPLEKKMLSASYSLIHHLGSQFLPSLNLSADFLLFWDAGSERHIKWSERYKCNSGFQNKSKVFRHSYDMVEMQGLPFVEFINTYFHIRC